MQQLLLLNEHRTRIVKALDAAVALAAVATVPITVLQLRGEQNAWVLAADWLIWIVFVVEYLVMRRFPPAEGGFTGGNEYDRRNFRDWRNWVSVAIIVLTFPPLAPLLRLVRLVRVVRLARVGRIAAVSTRALGHTLGRRGVLYVFGFVVLAIVLGGAAITSVESAVAGGESLADGVWWATLTAVGAGVGQPGPESIGGRAIALGLVLCGVGFVSTLAGSIAAYFLGEDEEDWAALHQRLDEIHAVVKPPPIETDPTTDEPRS